MNWGKSIVLAFVLFILFIGTLVVVIMRQDISLVTDNYYEQELRYQEQLDRMSNTNGLSEKPSITVFPGKVEIRYGRMTDVTVGELELFRPSDKRWDRRFTLLNQDSVQQFNVQELPRGMYKAKLRWSQDGKAFYLESTIYL
jgi:hypothetical protein